MKKRKDLKKLLNLEILDYTNLTPKFGDLDMPYVCCKTVPQIDYLATYSQPHTYFKTMYTALSFFEFDRFFDGLYGLSNAIYYGVKELQDFYIERFRGVKYFISPDYSKCGDSHEIENLHRQFRSRIVSIWLAINLNAVVIPLVSCANENEMKYLLDGMQDCNVVAFNAKGPLGDPKQLPIFVKSIKYAVDHLPKLKSIIVYSSTPKVEKIHKIFNYAIEKGVDVQVPENMLMLRNRLLGGDEE